MAQYQDYGFKGRAAIVTGAGSGVGESCAIELAKGGAQVALFGRRAALVEKVREECRKYTDKAHRVIRRRRRRERGEDRGRKGARHVRESGYPRQQRGN